MARAELTVDRTLSVEGTGTGSGSVASGTPVEVLLLAPVDMPVPINCQIAAGSESGTCSEVVADARWLVVHFDGQGLHVRFDNDFWVERHPASPESMVVADLVGTPGGRSPSTSETRVYRSVTATPCSGRRSAPRHRRAWRREIWMATARTNCWPIWATAASGPSSTMRNGRDCGWRPGRPGRRRPRPQRSG